MSAARFEHDCESCTFLGRLDGSDAYACTQGGTLPTIVLRWGDEPEDYRAAFQMFDKLTPELKDAARRWLEHDVVLEPIPAGTYELILDYFNRTAA